MGSVITKDLCHVKQPTEMSIYPTPQTLNTKPLHLCHVKKSKEMSIYPKPQTPNTKH